ncbi:MAG: anthranilate phosphoribosyltransferase, partial [Arenimonas sp.]
MLLAVLDNTPGPARDIVLLNAGAALYAANSARDIESGIVLARRVLENGSARAKVDEYVTATSRFAGR